MKSIPIELQQHKNLAVTSLCYLLLIVPNVGAAGGTPTALGFTNLDRSVVYNDGAGAIPYSASTAFDLSSLITSGDLSVDNAEAKILIPANELGQLTLADINGGRYDGAEYSLYQVNYRDLAVARHEVMLHGTIGRARVQGGLCCFAELRSLSQQCKQSAGGVWSLNCRGVLGRTTGKDPCPYDLGPEWVNCTVLTVDPSEPDRVFTVSALGVADQYMEPGMAQWLTGANAGLSDEIETQAADAISLRLPARFNVQPGDTLKVRRDCPGRFVEDCIMRFWGDEAPLRFRGEPHIPVGDQTAMMTPGAMQPPPNSGRPVEDVYNPEPDPGDIAAPPEGATEFDFLSPSFEVAGGSGDYLTGFWTPDSGDWFHQIDSIAGAAKFGAARISYDNTGAVPGADDSIWNDHEPTVTPGQQVTINGYAGMFGGATYGDFRAFITIEQLDATNAVVATTRPSTKTVGATDGHYVASDANSGAPERFYYLPITTKTTILPTVTHIRVAFTCTDTLGFADGGDCRFDGLSGYAVTP